MYLHHVRLLIASQIVYTPICMCEYLHIYNEKLSNIFHHISCLDIVYEYCRTQNMNMTI